MKKLLLAGVAAVGLTLSAGAAQAAFTGTTPGTNNVIGNIEGWFASTWYLIAGANTSIEVFYIGREAGAENTFTITGPGVGNSITVANTSYPNNPGLSTLVGGVVPTVSLGTLSIAPGLIDFSFTTEFTNPPSTVTNALNPAPLATPNFFAAVKTCDTSLALNGTNCSFAGGSTASSGNTLLLALDDGGGGSVPDDNHDDLVVVIRISNGSFEVPEPATLGLLGAGLLGLGFATRRRVAGRA